PTPPCIYTLSLHDALPISKILCTTFMVLGSIALSSCASKTGTGAAIGTAAGAALGAGIGYAVGGGEGALIGGAAGAVAGGVTGGDRKSTRLNSSHLGISYA